jgi:hypothetical protein
MRHQEAIRHLVRARLFMRRQIVRSKHRTWASCAPPITASPGPRATGPISPVPRVRHPGRRLRLGLLCRLRSRLPGRFLERGSRHLSLLRHAVVESARSAVATWGDCAVGFGFTIRYSHSRKGAWPAAWSLEYGSRRGRRRLVSLLEPFHGAPWRPGLGQAEAGAGAGDGLLTRSARRRPRFRRRGRGSLPAPWSPVAGR